MRKGWLLFLCACFFSSAAIAYQMNGTMHENGDGTYAVILESEDGHQYVGSGVYEGEGLLRITVRDHHGATYTGTALDDGDGDFQLDLKNVATGVIGSGTLELEQT